MPREPLGAKPWRPYPKQLEALVIASEGVPLSEIARRMGVKPPAVSALLSGAYARLGITRENTPGHHLSHARRVEAVRVCQVHGWWPPLAGNPVQLPPAWGVLTPDDVREIRAEPRSKGWARRMANRFGVSVHTVYRARSGTSWKDVT